MLFRENRLSWIKGDLHRQADDFKALTASKWLRAQRGSLTQFGIETIKDPPRDVLSAIGYLIWASSLLEEKVARAVFWLQCL